MAPLPCVLPVLISHSLLLSIPNAIAIPDTEGFISLSTMRLKYSLSLFCTATSSCKSILGMFMKCRFMLVYLALSPASSVRELVLVGNPMPFGLFLFVAIVVLTSSESPLSAQKSPLSSCSYKVVKVVENQFLRKLSLYRPPYRRLLRKIKI